MLRSSLVLDGMQEFYALPGRRCPCQTPSRPHDRAAAPTAAQGDLSPPAAGCGNAHPPCHLLVWVAAASQAPRRCQFPSRRKRAAASGCPAACPACPGFTDTAPDPRTVWFVVLALSLTSPLLVVAGLQFLRDGVLAVGRDACGTNVENDAEDRKRLLAGEI